MTRTPSASRPLVLFLGILLLGACEDAPTIPDAIQRVADGEEWVAMSVPAGLPRLDAWTAHISRSRDEGRAVLARVRDLEALSRAARWEGRIEAANQLQGEADRIAVLSLDRMPEAILLQRALHSIDFWGGRVRALPGLERFPDLVLAESTVRDGRGAAAAFLEGGDTVGAVLQIVTTSNLIRQHAPEAVALRVIGRVEARVDAQVLGPAAAERAFHLLANAREELIAGDPRRALHRALYALQIAEGSEVRLVSSSSDSLCGESRC
jgi:hypothetical protein